jgi:hypothetical protein
MSNEKGNGLLSCGVMNGEWETHKKEQASMVQGIRIANELLEEQRDYLKHLESLPIIADTLGTLKNKLIDVAIGKDQIPLDVAKTLFTEKQKTSDALYKILFIVIAGLLAILLFLLTGEHLGWIRPLVVPV